jgi:hypothetical protein
MHGAVPPLPQHAFMAWYSVKAHGQLYLYLLFKSMYQLHFAVSQNWPLYPIENEVTGLLKPSIKNQMNVSYENATAQDISFGKETQTVLY